VQRKVFRIEQTAVGHKPSPTQPGFEDSRAVSEPRRLADTAPAIDNELATIRDIITRTKRELSALMSDGGDRRMARAAGELAAAVECMETATQKVLASAETIDDCARALVSVLSDDYHHGLTQDVQDHVVRIYEACNFQDLAGQRIGKVIATLMMVEEELAGMIERCGTGIGPGRPATAPEPASSSLINGPRLDGDSGHATQQDIDLMFA
jgi:chemotaxis protein CheZ